MKKILSFIVLLSFVLTGLVFASTIPETTEPLGYPTVWTEQVYNGSGSDIATGQVVQWDFDTSNPTGTRYDDMLPYVAEADAAEDIWTAGVTLIEKGINNGEVGTIIIKGPAVVERGASATVNQLVAAEADGEIADFGGGANDECTVGRVIKNDAGANGYAGYSIIYVDPVCYDEN